ncbi:hypothetical protein MLD38_035743 [Melastoma candidum]|uniref:Uncharacterized protein n=1 Tax=Melastoma candidum TaxID=119954 RepID=A0ACB9LIG8_9MYRT|nr:hypothetical protein MLD38_035743 [Melastoma candidum]
MDRPPEDMQHLGFVGIFKESFKIIWKYKRTLSLITLVFVLPLAFIFLAQTQITDYFSFKIYKDQSHVDHAKGNKAHLSSIVTTDRIVYCLVNVGFYAILMVFSLLSVSAIVYLVACAYTVKPISFKKVMAVVPKVWKRLAVTLFWVGLASVLYSFFTLGLWVVVWGLFNLVSDALTWTVYIVLVILCVVGFAYLCIIWYLGSVISVLEDQKGIQAMVKAKDLFMGKRRVISFVFLLLGFIFQGIQNMFWYLVEFELNSAFHVGIGILCLFLLTILFLLGLVVQTVIYFVCKSYHYELVDKLALTEHLEAFLPNYDHLKEIKDVQLHQVNV